jgi:hypothetical protein
VTAWICKHGSWNRTAVIEKLRFLSKFSSHRCTLAQITRPPPNGTAKFSVEVRGEHPLGEDGTITCSNFLSYMRVPPDVRQWIVTVLQLGITVDNILDYIDSPDLLPAGVPRPPTQLV